MSTALTPPRPRTYSAPRRSPALPSPPGGQQGVHHEAGEPGKYSSRPLVSQPRFQPSERPSRWGQNSGPGDTITADLL